MSTMGHGFLGAGDPGALDAIYRRFLEDPHSVPRDIARAFARLADSTQGDAVSAWRADGWQAARLDPLGRAPGSPAILPAHPLQAVYGGHIGWQIAHLREPERRDWLQATAEGRHFAPAPAERDRILDTLVRAEAFERVLQRRFPTLKRFGLDGAEGFLLLCEEVLLAAASGGVRQLCCGGMHRGRLNVMANFIGRPAKEVIAGLAGAPNLPPGPGMSGDVAYHVGGRGERSIGGARIRLAMLPHPSHLSVVAPVALGRARALQRLEGAAGRSLVLPLIMHTDAAFSGQGIIAETLQLSRLPAYDTGGALHLILDNGIGFTTEPHEGRSTPFASDIAIGFGVPVLHVNGDAAEAVVEVARAAAEYRRRFQADVVIVLHGLRRAGHNEMDEPRFTQPGLYRRIATHPSPADRLARRHGLQSQAGERLLHWEAIFTAAAVAAAGHAPAAPAFGGRWSGLHRGSGGELTAFVATGLPEESLRRAGERLTAIPATMSIHPRIAKFLDMRRRSIETGIGITWATAEALAIATLAEDGFRVRLGGQDSVRGAFAQRHAELFDQRSDARHSIFHDFDGIELYNSPLCEYAALAFDYGISLADPGVLVCWEAQFGDFLNLAQALVDQFLTAGEERWHRSSGLTLLLPHGLDGGGPDHSTARPERLLAAAAADNLQVANPSTPAQYFHILRRQMLRPFRKPLAILSPKLMLRSSLCQSDMAEFLEGTGFRTVIADAKAGRCRRTIFCTGKFALELAAERERRKLVHAVRLIRIEQLWPLDEASISAALPSDAGTELIWAQEEPANMGCFPVLDRTLARIAGRDLRLVSRPAAAAPATGCHAVHDAEIRRLFDQALE